MSKPRSRSLSRWLVLLVAGAIVPLLVFAAATLMWVSATHREVRDRDLRETARALALAVDGEVRAWKSAVTALGASRSLEQTRYADFYEEARRVAAPHDGWVVLSDPTGKQLVNTLRPLGSPLPVSNSAILTAFNDPSPVVLDPFFDVVSQRLVVSVVLPVFRSGERAYVLDMSFGPERLSQLLQQHRLPDSWVAGINDRQNRVVAHSRTPSHSWLPATTDSSDSAVVTNLLTDGREARVALQRLGEVPWLLVLAVPTSHLHTTTPLVTFLVAGALLGLTALAVAVYLGRKIARPVMDLAARSHSLLRGDPGPVEIPSGIREVQELQAALLRASASAEAYFRERADLQVALETAEASRASGEALRQANERISSQQHLLQTILEQAAEGITVRDAQGRVTFVNKVARRRATMPPEGTTLEMAPQVWGDYLDVDGKPLPLEQWPMTRALHGETVATEFKRVSPAGTIFVVNSAAPLKNDKGEIIGMVAITMDITERKRTEDRLRQALRDKEQALADNLTLIGEVHHRTKNNLQMLCDLLYLQMETMTDAEKRAVLEDTYTRIYAIARLHEQLYQSMQSGRVQLGEYLARLVAGLTDLRADVRVSLDATEPIYLDLDRAIHTGLIVNELVTNACKHAFPDGARGEVRVSAWALGDTLELQVRDTGPGLPPGLDPAQAKGLGLRIVHILARRLQATVRAESRGGACFTIRFPLNMDE